MSSRSNVKGMRELMARLNRMGREAQSVKKGALEAGAKPVFDEMEARKPSAQSKIMVSDVKNDIIEIGPSDLDFISRFAEFGTSPHLEKAKNKKVMSDGSTFYGREVDHPGHQAMPFIEPAFNAKKNEAQREIRRYLERELLR
ncbi:hypothetical protein MOB65_19320 [Bacillus inaquosorum]|uniref:HK97-gp10 family putative phage morphogenesis protein n=1 Tax=Bacillus inaquosorum TaxID=483913 RepID=UPI0022804605|nr:HK97-gp10 family putative phage morphogenesis protein [Bacillus inaquosorum]MCY7751644.1 hypothetical protein [Bacillus inaquosorum]MCY7911015.1 hypothetical protein [Bacillus inaquosorum]MCY9456788.1 hypothetical protein [Bacillus inaquosorum]